MKKMQHIAIDLGAESGRVMAGTIHPEESTFTLEEIHRFPNASTRHPDGSMHWHLESLLEHCIEGLRQASLAGIHPQSIGVDSWGVDYVLLDHEGKWLMPVHHYRDSRSARGVGNALKRLPWESIFAETGIQYMPLNSLFQVMAEPREKLERAHTILGIGDAIQHQLGGRPVYEVSMASTTQFYNPSTRQWSDKVINAMGLRREMFPEIVASGTETGVLRGEILARCGWQSAPPKIIATCTHDTGSAVASIPAEDGHWAYLSSGTWSLMGVECPEPIINDQSRALNFTNEVGYGHTIRLLKNISGMWLIQECRRTWQQDGFQYSYEDLSRIAEPEPAFQCLIDPTDASFLSPVSMPDAMDNFCRRTGQPVPRSHGQYIRCALDSLALLYAKTLRELEELTGIHRTVLHIVGGGSRNRLLNQLAANATQIPVIAGPVEATALGNILIQYAQTSRIPLASARKSLLISFPTQKFLPQANSVEKSTYEKFLQISCE